MPPQVGAEPQPGAPIAGRAAADHHAAPWSAPSDVAAPAPLEHPALATGQAGQAARVTIEVPGDLHERTGGVCNRCPAGHFAGPTAGAESAHGGGSCTARPSAVTRSSRTLRPLDRCVASRSSALLLSASGTLGRGIALRTPTPDRGLAPALAPLRPAAACALYAPVAHAPFSSASHQRGVCWLGLI